MCSRRRRLSLQLVVALLVLTSLLASCTAAPAPAPSTPPTTAPAATQPQAATATAQTVADTPTAASAEGSVKLTMWWWGEQDAPGLKAWINDVISMYTADHPNVEIEEVLQGTDETIPTYHAAVAANQGPDIATLWYGGYMWEDVWAGNVEPISDYVSEDELGHWVAKKMSTFDGQIWATDLYGYSMVMAYNKDLFAEAGLDPENPPRTWEEFMEACGTLREADITPVALGASDGWSAVVLTNYFMYQTVNDVKGLAEAVMGERSWTDPALADMWNRIAEMRDNGFFNEDASGLTFFDGMQKFVTGEAAMTFVASPTAVAWIQEMGEDTVGIMFPPSVGDELVDYVTSQGMTAFITPWSENKEVAADFLTFFHSEAAMESLYETLNGMVLPADDRFDRAMIESETIQQLWDMQLAGFERNVAFTDGVIPYAILGDGMMPALSMMFSDNLSAEDAAQMTEDAASAWRQLSPEYLEMFEKWAAEQ